MTLKLLLASRNQHKIEELQQMLTDLNIKVISLNDVSGAPVVKTGQTFARKCQQKSPSYSYVHRFYLPG